MNPWPSRLISWLTDTPAGQPSGWIVAAVVLVLSLTATVGQAIAFPHSDTTESFARGMAVLLAINALIGLVLALTANPAALILADRGGSVDRALHGLTRVWPSIGLSMALQTLAGIPIVIVFGSGEWTRAFSPLLFGAALPLVSILLALLAGWLVLWPVILLARELWMLVTGRRADGAVTAASIVILTVAALAVTAALGTDFDARGERGRILAIVRLWVDQTGDPLTLSFRWVARSLMVLVLIEATWLIAAARSRRRRDSRDTDT